MPLSVLMPAPVNATTRWDCANHWAIIFSVSDVLPVTGPLLPPCAMRVDSHEPHRMAALVNLPGAETVREIPRMWRFATGGMPTPEDRGRLSIVPIQLT